MKGSARAIPFALTAVLTGCLPWPHQVETAPRLSGKIIRDGAPVSGVRVRLSENVMQDAAEKVEVASDTDGRFEIGPIRRLVWFVHVPVLVAKDGAPVWGLQLKESGQPWVPGWTPDLLAIGYTPKDPLFANCDLSADKLADEIHGALLRGTGKCDLLIGQPKE